MADTPAAAPVAAPTNAAPTAPQAVDDDSQIIADLRAEHYAKAQEPDPEEEEPKAPKAKAPKTEKAKAPSVKYESADAAMSAIVKAFETGDPKAIAKALGKPEAFLDVSQHKWLAFREQTKAVRDRERGVIKRESEFNTRLAEAKKMHTPILEAAEAYKAGKFDRFVNLIEELTGDTYDEAQRKVIKGEVALDPEVKRLRKEMQALRDETKLEKAEAEARAHAGNQDAQFKRAITMVQTELASHPISKVKGFEKMVLDRVRESWDADAREYTLSFEDAGDEIVESRLAEVEALRPKPKALPTARPAPGVPPRSRAADARAPDGDDWLTRDLTEEELVASIERDARSGRIK